MNKFKKQVITKEFPALVTVLEKLEKGLSEITAIKIARVDRTFLFSIPEDHYHDGSCGEEFFYDRLFAVVEGGVEEVNLNPHYKRDSNYAHSVREERDGDTFLAAIDAAGREVADYYIRYQRDYVNWGQGDLVDERKITVLKPPKGFTVTSCVEEAERQARQELAKELDAINSVPVKLK